MALVERSWLRTALIVALLLLVVTSLAACSETDGGSQPSTAGVGAAAPRFSLASADGGTIALEDYVGHKPVLLYFSMGPG
jgi:cytochrome oxidase Cu insertion factor (SCO1/SenC/PrrC family)